MDRLEEGGWSMRKEGMEGRVEEGEDGREGERRGEEERKGES